MGYTSVFENMNRKERRAFEKMSVEEKNRLMVSEITKKAVGAAQDEIINSFYKGYLTAFHHIGEKYIVPIANAEENEEVLKLFTSLMEECQRTYEVAKIELDKPEEDKEKKE